MPVVAARRLKGDVEHGHLLCGERRKIALSDEVVAVGIRLSDGEEDLVLELILFAESGGFFVPDLFGKAEHRPTLRPADVHRRVGDDRGDLFLGHAVSLGVLQMVGEGRISDARRHQRYDRDDTFGLDVDRFLVPHLAEQYVIIQMREHRRKLAELIPAGGLCDLFHSISPLHFSFIIPNRSSFFKCLIRSVAVFMKYSLRGAQRLRLRLLRRNHVPPRMTI